MNCTVPVIRSIINGCNGSVKFAAEPGVRPMNSNVKRSIRCFEIKRKTISTLFLIFTASVVFSAKLDSQKLVGLKVYVKHNLIFLQDPPKVYPGKIIFTRESNLCDDPLWGIVIGRGSQVEIVKISKLSGFERVTINASGFGSFEILLEKSKWGRFEKSFNEIFSMIAVEESNGRCEPKTEQDLIKCYGYPIYECNKDGRKFYYYNQGFVGRRIHGYHDVWIEIKSDIVVEEHGYI